MILKHEKPSRASWKTWVALRSMLLVQLAYAQGFGPRIGLTLSCDALQSSLKVATP
jgi:hypothetical protein